MGSVIGPKLADNYMNKIDERISSLTGIKYYARYVDDIIIVYDSQTVSSKHIEEYANGLHKNLKFTSEDEQQNKMNFLDVTIKREETSVSFKNKKNVFIMELRKILNRTTQQENIDIEVKQLFKKFQLNDYPKHILFASQKNKMSNIISIMNSENSPRDQFKIAGVVYRMSCTCGNPNYYIGETGRRLELRVREHEAAIRLRRTESAWFLHCQKFNCNINIKNTKILYRIENNLERKIVEHFCIAEHVNLLNLNAGLIVDACWERLLGIKRNQRITS
ncbi:uncharacterized protein [Centruroides vittatus]|uniref:uncharacterized protein isoform X2 n=1 Tax=Centruroides vittatus TaxID=120091 RepID=UPI00350EF390